MPLKLQSIISQNITLLYDSLDLSPAHIDRNRLRGSTDSDTVVMDTPEMIVAIQPINQTIIQLGDRRIRITVQKQAVEIGTFPIWTTASHLHTLVTRDVLIAYGFNFELLVELAADSRAALLDRFVSDAARLTEQLHGELQSVVPRFRYVGDPGQYDLILDPQEGQFLRAYLNVHFQDKQLPPTTQLEAEYRAEFNRLSQTLNRLLGGDA